MTALRPALKRLAFASFLLLDRAGVHLLPKHYYTPLPDYAWLRRNTRAWRRRAPLHGVAWDLDAQLAWVERTCSGHYAEVAGLARYREIAGRGLGPGFGEIESQVLHCFVRAAAPARVVEVGSGVSTAVMAGAAARNVAEGRSGTEITAIDPFARPAVAALPGVEVVRVPAQEAPRTVFERLRAGDVLFIDSSHAVKTGSEVIRLYLDVVPALPPGITIHVHDVYLPYAYSRHVTSTFFDWQETTLVLALLTGNAHLRVVASLSALHYDRRDDLARTLTDYRPQTDDEGIAAAMSGHFPSSLWLETA